MKNATIVIPTYNEKENVKVLIPGIFEVVDQIQNWNISLLIVDDNSPDNTAGEIINLQKKYKNLYLSKSKKEGLGKAYLKGFAYALEKLNPFVLFEMDADLQHSPLLIPQFLKKIESGSDFVIGSRYIQGGSIPKTWGIHRKIFSILGNQIIRFGFMDLKIHDWTSGYRAVKASFLKEVLTQMNNFNGYVFQVALLDKAKRAKLKIAEVPLKFTDRSSGTSKIDSVEFIINVIYYILTNSSFIKYFIVGVIGAAVDFGISFFLIEKVKYAIWISTIISAQLAIISNFLLNNFWSFAHKKIERGIMPFIVSFARFNLIAVGAIIIQVLCLHLATTFFPREFWYIYKAIIIVFLIIPYSYFLYNYIIWKDK